MQTNIRENPEQGYEMINKWKLEYWFWEHLLLWRAQRFGDQHLAIVQTCHTNQSKWSFCPSRNKMLSSWAVLFGHIKHEDLIPYKIHFQSSLFFQFPSEMRENNDEKIQTASELLCLQSVGYQIMCTQQFSKPHNINQISKFMKSHNNKLL